LLATVRKQSWITTVPINKDITVKKTTNAKGGVDMKLKMLKMSKKQIISALCIIGVFGIGAIVGAQIYANAASNAIAVLPLSKGGTNATSATAAASSILGTNYANYNATLPIAKGGSGATTATNAANNILGSNYANYSGILPIAKGGTNSNTAARGATNILGSNFANYSGTLPTSKGGTGLTGALATAISSSSTDTQIPTAKSVYDRAPRVQKGSFNKTTTGGTGWPSVEVTGLTGFTSAPTIFIQPRASYTTGAVISGVQAMVNSVTTAKFVCSIWNSSSTSATADFDWMAVGW
jgi:hypothetical protein